MAAPLAPRNAEWAWRSLETTRVRRSEKLIGAFYRNALALRLHALGYAIAPTRIGRLPGFEIAGYDRALLDAFSGRRREILAWLAAHGLPYTNASSMGVPSRQDQDPHSKESPSSRRDLAATTPPPLRRQYPGEIGSSRYRTLPRTSRGPSCVARRRRSGATSRATRLGAPTARAANPHLPRRSDPRRSSASFG